MKINEMVTEAHAGASARGWWDKMRYTQRFEREVVPLGLDPAAVIAHLPAALLLVHSEVSEGCEDVRVGRLVTVLREDGKPEGLPSELADVVIRVADLCGALGIDLEREIRQKMAYNQTRSFRHGGKLL